MIRLLKSSGIRIMRGLTSHEQKILRDGEEPTHYSQRVGHEVSGDMVCPMKEMWLAWEGYPKNASRLWALESPGKFAACGKFTPKFTDITRLFPAAKFIGTIQEAALLCSDQGPIVLFDRQLVEHRDFVREITGSKPRSNNIIQFIHSPTIGFFRINLQKGKIKYRPNA